MEQGSEKPNEAAASTDKSGEKTNVSRGPLGIDLPANPQILAEARRLAGEADVRIQTLAAIIAQDPVISLEILRGANSTFFTGDRPPTTSIKNGVVRLGSGTVANVLDGIATRSALPTPELAGQLEVLRMLSQQVAVVSVIIAKTVAGELVESAQTGGLMFHMGQMIACAYLGDRYLAVTGAKNNSAIAYKLLHDYEFDMRSIQLSYLRNRGVPQEIFFALDRDLQCKTPIQATLRFIVQGAHELVEAALGGKWDKYSPSTPLPAKSTLRLLKLTEYQYSDIFGQVEAFLTGSGEDFDVEDIEEEESEGQASSSQNAKTGTPVLSSVSSPIDSPPVDIAIPVEPIPDVYNKEDFDKQVSALCNKNQDMIEYLQSLCSKCSSVDELLTRTLSLLVNNGPYDRAALVLVGANREKGIIHTSVGSQLADSKELTFSDPLSPIAMCLNKVSSFNTSHEMPDETLSPFGITAFALSPLNVDEDTPVVLYADCGDERPIPMEARKVFRLVVALLNQLLPSLPGGLVKDNGIKPISLT
jgi:HD-like signal output (HDOD) protein